MTPEIILSSIGLAVTGWLLLEVLRLRVEVATLTQRVNDLPCYHCYVPPKRPPTAP